MQVRFTFVSRFDAFSFFYYPNISKGWCITKSLYLCFPNVWNRTLRNVQMQMCECYRAILKILKQHWYISVQWGEKCIGGIWRYMGVYAGIWGCAVFYRLNLFTDEAWAWPWREMLRPVLYTETMNQHWSMFQIIVSFLSNWLHISDSIRIT